MVYMELCNKTLYIARERLAHGALYHSRPAPAPAAGADRSAARPGAGALATQHLGWPRPDRAAPSAPANRPRPRRAALVCAPHRSAPYPAGPPVLARCWAD